ncbi:hypothetical protein M3223_13260 [Paenibacillus pasadenensis]|uniref:hypothetical protein n=1 Tax=Paenibacillus pasadenensis TaxID=217090 RepID=UPI0020417E1D|nr:hypothetical protein [Paenibacillus pasadenensis]MCM3748319.1 hypothetical protein [Paenibacillus pasadenensis]
MSGRDLEAFPMRDGQAGTPHRDVSKANNGSMVQDEQDMKRLGKDMERVRTNAELEKDGLVPDPIQE